MAGLLDFLNTPAGQGLLSGVASYAMNARRGTPVNNLGRGLAGGITGYSQANDQLRKDEENKFQKQYRQLQMDEITRKRADQDAYRAQFKPGTLQPFKPDDPFNEGAATFGENNLYTGEKPSFAGNAIDPKLAAIAPFLDPKEMYSALGPKDPIKLGAGDVLIDPNTKQPIFTAPKADPEKDRLYSMMEAAGIDPNSTQGQQVISNWINKQTTHAPPVPSFQYVQGDGYRPGGVFDTRGGGFQPIGGQPQEQAEPVDPRAPWGHLPTPKARDEMRTKLYGAESKKLDDLREQVAKGDQVMRDLERFGELNREQSTGSMLDRSPLWTIDSEKREMEAIAARLAPQARPAGSGTTSDRDLALYLQGLPGVDKPGDVNRNIREQYSKNVTEAKQKLDFAERYFAEFGHLNGWEKAWRDQNGPAVQPADATQDEKAYIQKRRSEGANDAQIAQELQKRTSKPAAKNQSFALPPNAKQYEGKTIKDTKTGKRFHAKGGKWVEIK